jgi:hypothetical protein
MTNGETLLDGVRVFALTSADTEYGPQARAALGGSQQVVQAVQAAASEEQAGQRAGGLG